MAQYLRRLGTSGDPAVRNLASATIDALKVLFEAATAAPSVRIVFTLATGTAAFGTETADVERALADAAAQSLAQEASDVMARPMGAVGRPAEDHEIGHILRRRLFESVDAEAAEAAAEAYRGLYAALAGRGVGCGAATDDPAGYARRLETSYPFHPALIDCLDKRIGPLPGFQRARGALKMLAESVASLWAGAAASIVSAAGAGPTGGGGGGSNGPAILNLGDLPLEAAAVAASLRKLADSAKLQTRVAVCRAYRHLWWPAHNPTGDDLRHFELPARDQGQVKGPQTGVVLDALRTHGKVSDSPPPTDRLAAASGFNHSGEVTAKALAETPWRDHRQPVPLNPNLLTDAIAAGVRNGTWVYYDARSERAYTDTSRPPTVRLGSDAWLYSRARAEELGLLREKVTVPLIAEALASVPGGPEAGTLDGAALRRRLEEAVGGEPTKRELLEVLAAGAQTGDRLVVVEGTPGEDSKPLTPGAIRNARLENLTVLSAAAAAAAAALGLEGSRPKTLEATGHGSVGTALQQVKDRLGDLGGGAVASVSVTASADVGEGVRDLRLLGYCVSQLPRLACSVRLRATGNGFEGLKGGLKVELSGEASAYQQTEERLLAVLERAGDVSGHLELTLTPATPMELDGADWQQFASVLAANNPGDVKITARLAPSDAPGLRARGEA